jgi:hypothetical protein
MEGDREYDAYDRGEDEALARIRDRDAMSEVETDSESNVPSSYHNQWIKATLRMVEERFETRPHPYWEDEYYGYEFMQYRVAQTPSAEIFLRFCEYGARSFIELDGKFFYETDQLSLIATLDELDGNGQGRAEKNGALQTEAWGGPVAAPTPA